MKESAKTMAVGGLAGWLLRRLRTAHRTQPRLALLERIALAPRQSLALVEADGRRFLVATSPEGAPAFFPLEQWPQPPGLSYRRPLIRPAHPAAQNHARVSW